MCDALSNLLKEEIAEEKDKARKEGRKEGREQAMAAMGIPDEKWGLYKAKL